MIPGNTLEVSTPSDREIDLVRSFDAPRRLVFEAYTKPELLKRWLGVFGGWSLDVCEIDLRPGGRYRYVWRNGETSMGMGGVFHEIVVPERIVSAEKFDDPWYEGQALCTVTFVEKAAKTTLTMRLLYDSKAIRDSVLQSPMEKGVGAGFDMLDKLLAESAAAGGTR
jgi:uncharacterized protein YndB with AHSA1/START domain